MINAAAIIEWLVNVEISLRPVSPFLLGCLLLVFFFDLDQPIPCVIIFFFFSSHVLSEEGVFRSSRKWECCDLVLVTGPFLFQNLSHNLLFFSPWVCGIKRSATVDFISSGAFIRRGYRFLRRLLPRRPIVLPPHESPSVGCNVKNWRQPCSPDPVHDLEAICSAQCINFTGRQIPGVVGWR